MEDAGLKVVFSEVLKGFTLVESKNYGKIQVKHFTNFDSAELDIKNKLFYDKAISQGLPSRNDRIEYLLKENICFPICLLFLKISNSILFKFS